LRMLTTVWAERAAGARSRGRQKVRRLMGRGWGRGGRGWAVFRTGDEGTQCGGDIDAPA
jgi:hypothetical protein